MFLQEKGEDQGLHFYILYPEFIIGFLMNWFKMIYIPSSTYYLILNKAFCRTGLKEESKLPPIPSKMESVPEDLERNDGTDGDTNNDGDKKDDVDNEELKKEESKITKMFKSLGKAEIKAEENNKEMKTIEDKENFDDKIHEEDENKENEEISPRKKVSFFSRFSRKKDSNPVKPKDQKLITDKETADDNTVKQNAADNNTENESDDDSEASSDYSSSSTDKFNHREAIKDKSDENNDYQTRNKQTVSRSKNVKQSSNKVQSKSCSIL